MQRKQFVQPVFSRILVPKLELENEGCLVRRVGRMLTVKLRRVFTARLGMVLARGLTPARCPRERRVTIPVFLVQIGIIGANVTPPGFLAVERGGNH